MRNLLINLTFIFILVLGSASDAFSQRNIGSIEILNFNFIGSIEILGVGDGNRIADDSTPNITVSISSLEGNVIFLEHKESYASPNMQILIEQEKIEELSKGTYLLTVKIEDTLIGTEQVSIK